MAELLLDKGYEVINLGSDEPVVLKDANRLIDWLVDRQARVEFKPRYPTDVTATWADISKAERGLKWRPKTRFEDGIQQFVNWYRQNREWTEDIKTG